MFANTELTDTSFELSENSTMLQNAKGVSVSSYGMLNKFAFLAFLGEGGGGGG